MSAEQATSNPAQPPDGSIKGCVSGRQCDRETIKSAGNFVITVCEMCKFKTDEIDYL